MIDTTPLPRSFYARPALEVARAVLGCHLIHEQAGMRLVGHIIETEAYGGSDDSASHAFRGPTPRNEPMFGPAGHAYVYLIYGLHAMLNLVTGPEGEASAVLVRAITPIAGLETMRTRRHGRRGIADGPGKLTQAMGISLAARNRHDLCLGEGLWLAPGRPAQCQEILAGPRVGIDYATPEHRQAPWRLRLVQPAT